MSDSTPNDELRELVERIEQERIDVLENDTATDSAKAHRNGVACGMDYFKDELEEVIEDEF